MSAPSVPSTEPVGVTSTASGADADAASGALSPEKADAVESSFSKADSSLPPTLPGKSAAVEIKPFLCPKCTTVYVGKIPARLVDADILKLLETCGKVEKWDRAADRFGYCDFDDAPAVVCAVRVLNDLELGDSKLLVKLHKKTKAYVAEYFQRKLLMPGSLPDAGDDADLSQEDREENARAALSKLVQAIQDRGPSSNVHKKPDLMACEALLQAELRRQGVEDPARIRQRLAELQRRHEAKLEQRYRKVKREWEEFRQEEARRSSREAREYAERERQWESRERRKARDRRRDQEREEQDTEDRQLEATSDLEHSPKRRNSRRRLRRREEREREERHDARESKRLRSSSALPSAARSSVERGSSSRKNGLAVDHTAREIDMQDVESSVMITVHPNEQSRRQGEPTRANTAKALDTSMEEREEGPDAHNSPPRVALSLGKRKKSSTRDGPALFADAPVQDEFFSRGRQRTLTKLETSIHDSGIHSIKDRIASIPTTKEDLFAYELDWSLVEKPGLLDTTIRSWIAEQIAEYLGEEDATLINFVMTQLKQHVTPADLVQQLAALLDDDAEEFAMKLWRKLILSTLSS